EHKAKGRVVYQLKGAAVPVRNSLRPLPTGFFPTPVGQIELAKQDGGAALIIELQQAAEPSYRVIETPRGITLQVDFPALSKPPVKAGGTRHKAPAPLGGRLCRGPAAPAAEPGARLTFQADHADADLKLGRLTLKGHVVLAVGRYRLTGDRLEIVVGDG